MSFKPINISQQDARWKNIKLGFSNDSTIGVYGCALTSVCMWLSGFGYPETPDKLNEKLKQRNGYQQDAIVWSAVSAIYPNVKFKSLIICTDANAPIDLIAASIASGQPVILEVDNSPKAGLQTHWVVAYAKVGKDFLILDPWPNPPEQGNDISLMRYSQGKELKRSIMAVVLYECQTAGDGSSPTPPPLNDGSLYVRVGEAVTAGLRIRSAPSTASDTLSLEITGAYLKVLEPEAALRSKIGMNDQWLRISNAVGVEGFVAAWLVVATTVGGSPPPPPPPPEDDKTIKRIRASIGDGLESVPTSVAAEKRLAASPTQSGSYRLVADIWNRYGGILGALSAKLNIESGVAVATLGVESGGQAFGIDGRTLIRFENHLFYTYWGKNNLDKFNKFFAFNNNQRWMGHKWRSDPKKAWTDFHGNQAREWDVFSFARSLDESAAMLSISMGAPQIMGFNFGVIGYASVQDMFAAFARSDRDQVIAFFDFIQGTLPNAGAVKVLQARNFLQFATIYNGSGQAPTYAGLINSGYTAFLSLYAGLPVQPPSPPPDPAAPPDNPPPTPDPVDGDMSVEVLSSAGKTGLKMFQKPRIEAGVITTLSVGMVLRVLDADKGEVRKHLGKKNEWVYVRDYQARKGYVQAMFVGEKTNSPVTFSILDLAEPESITVYVAGSAGKSGLLLRVQPTSYAPSVKSLPVNTTLQVLDDPLIASQKVGVYNQWIKVKEPLGAEGYVAAWFVKR